MSRWRCTCRAWRLCLAPRWRNNKAKHTALPCPPRALAPRLLQVALHTVMTTRRCGCTGALRQRLALRAIQVPCTGLINHRHRCYVLQGHRLHPQALLSLQQLLHHHLQRRPMCLLILGCVSAHHLL